MVSRRLVLFAWIVIVIACSCADNLWAGVSISPAFVELSLDRGRAAGQFSISNTGDQPERYRIRATHFVFTVNGGLSQTEPDSNSLVPWIKFNPKEFSLPPRSNRTIRFVVVPKGKLADQEYWAAMELESLRQNIARSKEDEAGRSIKLRVIASLLVPIFAVKGKISSQADLEELKIIKEDSKTRIEALVSNTGNGHLRGSGTYQIIDLSGTILTEGSLGTHYLLAFSQRKFKIPIKEPIPDGLCTVKVEYVSPQLEGPIKRSIQYDFQ